MAKLTARQKENIKKLILENELSFSDIAKKYDVTKAVISRLAKPLKELKQAKQKGAERAMSEIKTQLEAEGHAEVYNTLSQLKGFNIKLIKSFSTILENNINDGSLEKIKIEDISKLNQFITAFKSIGELTHQFGLAELNSLNNKKLKVDFQNNISLYLEPIREKIVIDFR